MNPSKIDDVLVDHPWPWHIDDEFGSLVDVRGRFVLVTNDAILELVKAHVEETQAKEVHDE